MATRSKRAARDDARALTTVAYRGHELDELIAASNEVPVMSQTELLESQPTVAQSVTELDDEDYEVFEAHTAERGDPETYEPGYEAENEHEPMPESVPIVESTVVIASADIFGDLPLPVPRAQAQVRAPAPPPVAAAPLDSQRPVAYSVPSCPSTSSLVPPIAYTLGEGIESAAFRSPARAPALITLTIAVVAITVGVLLGSSFSQALSQPARQSAAAAPSTVTPAAHSSADAEPAAPRHAEPRAGVDEKVSLADAGVREKATRPSKPIGMMVSAGRRQPGAAQSASPSAFEAELRAKMLQGEKAAGASHGAAEAIGEAQLNRPF